MPSGEEDLQLRKLQLKVEGVHNSILYIWDQNQDTNNSQPDAGDKLGLEGILEKLNTLDTNKLRYEIYTEIDEIIRKVNKKTLNENSQKLIQIRTYMLKYIFRAESNISKLQQYAIRIKNYIKHSQRTFSKPEELKSLNEELKLLREELLEAVKTEKKQFKTHEQLEEQAQLQKYIELDGLLLEIQKKIQEIIDKKTGNINNDNIVDILELCSNCALGGDNSVKMEIQLDNLIHAYEYGTDKITDKIKEIKKEIKTICYRADERVRGFGQEKETAAAKEVDRQEGKKQEEAPAGAAPAAEVPPAEATAPAAEAPAGEGSSLVEAEVVVDAPAAPKEATPSTGTIEAASPVLEVVEEEGEEKAAASTEALAETVSTEAVSTQKAAAAAGQKGVEAARQDAAPAVVAPPLSPAAATLAVTPATDTIDAVPVAVLAETKEEAAPKEEDTAAEEARREAPAGTASDTEAPEEGDGEAASTEVARQDAALAAAATPAAAATLPDAKVEVVPPVETPAPPPVETPAKAARKKAAEVAPTPAAREKAAVGAEAAPAGSAPDADAALAEAPPVEAAAPPPPTASTEDAEQMHHPQKRRRKRSRKQPKKEKTPAEPPSPKEKDTATNKARQEGVEEAPAKKAAETEEEAAEEEAAAATKVEAIKESIRNTIKTAEVEIDKQYIDDNVKEKFTAFRNKLKDIIEIEKLDIMKTEVNDFITKIRKEETEEKMRIRGELNTKLDTLFELTDQNIYNKTIEKIKKVKELYTDLVSSLPLRLFKAHNIKDFEGFEGMKKPDDEIKKFIEELINEIMKEITGMTAEILQPLIKKPKLTPKLLGKPPFRFLHDIISELTRSTGFAEGLYTDAERDAGSIKDKDSKIAYLKKIHKYVDAARVEDIPLKLGKVVKGMEPDKTNAFLQVMAEAATDQGLDRDACLAAVLGESVDETKELDQTQSGNP